MKRDPNDPNGEFERRNYRLNNVVDGFCAEEGNPFLRQETWERFTKGTNPPTITDLVHEVINQREIIGRAIYHRPLTAFDGRDSLQDAIEEAADLLQYLVKLKVECG